MDKRSKMKAGLFFGMTIFLFFLGRDLLTHDNLTTKQIFISMVSALVGGVWSGVLFGWLMGKLTKSKWLQNIEIKTDEDETILFETGVNHFKGIEAAGGKLFLTNKRLVFKSHKINLQNHELSIPLSDIDKVGKYKTFRLVNNGLFVKTKDSKVEKFVVQKIDIWMIHLSEKGGLYPVHALK